MRLCAGLLMLVGAVAAMGQAAPAWKTAAGGQQQFEVASIRLSEPGKEIGGNFPLSADNSYARTGGLMSADFPLVVYIQFAYKLWLTRPQTRALMDQLPKAVAGKSYAIRARAAGEPTKDQMRLMVRSLLEERFGLKVHFEEKESPVLAMVLLKPGKTGPTLKPHMEGASCDASAASCNGAGPMGNGMFRLAMRDVGMDLIAAGLSIARIGPQIVDRTGLTGTWDFGVEFMPEASGPTQTNGFTPGKGDTTGEPIGPTFLEALKEQLGVKLEAATAPLRVMVLDHVEVPSEN